MKKIVVIIFVCLMIFPLFFFGCSKENKQINSYDIVLNYDNLTQTAACHESVNYANLSENALSDICFHLYPKAFSENSKQTVVSNALKEKAYYDDNFYGNIEIQNVKIAQNDVEFNIDENDILQVLLSKTLYPDERVQIDIDFLLILPHINHRFGYGDNTVNFGNFYPIVCVYENGFGFKKDGYSSNGDPFYSDVANYHVTVNYDSKFLLASTGEQSTTNRGETKSTKVIANNVRDFCFVLSEKFSCVEKQVGETKVKYFYYDDEDAEKSLQISCDALKTFNDMFGKYPYKQLCIVKSNFVHGGMEYPNLVMISDDISNHLDYEYVIVHEIGHQWWYGVVGNDEFDEGWVDESLTEYSTLLFFEQNRQYGLNYSDMINNANSAYKQFLGVYTKIYDNFDTSMNRKLNEFKTEPEYVNLVYTKGVLMYDTIRQMVGEKKFLKCLQKYFEKYKFKNVTGDELIEVFEKYANNDVGNIFRVWLNGDVVII